MCLDPKIRRSLPPPLNINSSPIRLKKGILRLRYRTQLAIVFFSASSFTTFRYWKPPLGKSDNVHSKTFARHKHPHYSDCGRSWSEGAATPTEVVKQFMQMSCRFRKVFLEFVLCRAHVFIVLLVARGRRRWQNVSDFLRNWFRASWVFLSREGLVNQFL